MAMLEIGRAGRGGEAAFVLPERAVDYVETLVAFTLKVPRESLHGDSRGEAPVAFARQVAMYLAYTRLRLPFRDVGRLFGRDRTTVSHACHAVEDRREDAAIDRMLDGLERAVDLWLETAGRHG